MSALYLTPNSPYDQTIVIWENNGTSGANRCEWWEAENLILALSKMHYRITGIYLADSIKGLKPATTRSSRHE